MRLTWRESHTRDHFCWTQASDRILVACRSTAGVVNVQANVGTNLIQSNGQHLLRTERYGIAFSLLLDLKGVDDACGLLVVTQSNKTGIAGYQSKRDNGVVNGIPSKSTEIGQLLTRRYRVIAHGSVLDIVDFVQRQSRIYHVDGKKALSTGRRERRPSYGGLHEPEVKSRGPPRACRCTQDEAGHSVGIRVVASEWTEETVVDALGRIEQVRGSSCGGCALPPRHFAAQSRLQHSARYLLAPNVNITRILVNIDHKKFHLLWQFCVIRPQLWRAFHPGKASLHRSHRDRRASNRQLLTMMPRRHMRKSHQAVESRTLYTKLQILDNYRPTL